MRPVNKGEAPDKKFKDYWELEPYLEKRIGTYCSFCELRLSHVPEVEHKEAKARGGDKLKWENLLLSCKYCNTRKGTKVKRGDKDKYLWPDEDDTFHAFSYDTEIPQLNETYLESKGTTVKQKAENLFRLVKLDNNPSSPKEKDRRYMKRNEARNSALMSMEGWDRIKHSPDKSDYLKMIGISAKESGFFSVWMNVFKDDLEVKEMLIKVFPGTREEFCID